LFKRNWKDIEPRLEDDGNCISRYYFRRKDLLSVEGGYEITEYLEWVKRVTIPLEKKLPYKKQNLEKILYVLQGKGIIEVGEKKHIIEAPDTVYIPTLTPHSIYPTTEGQPLIYMDYAVRTPPDAEKVITDEASSQEKIGNGIRIERWTTKKASFGHNGTCFGYPLFSRDIMQYLLFATMMTVPNVLGYHRHNTEAIYYIDSGIGHVKVGGEELEIQPGDAVYIPNAVAHMCKSSIKGQPLNVFCQGIAIPYDAKTWTEEDIPDIPV